VPYFISGFPGTTHEKMEKVYDYMKDKGWNLQQVQAFIPTPMTLATAMYWSGVDPMSMKPLFVAKDWKDRKIQQALLQPHKPEHSEILRSYRQKQRGAPKPQAVSGQVSGKKPGSRTVVDAPKGSLGRKLLL